MAVGTVALLGLCLSIEIVACFFLESPGAVIGVLYEEIGVVDYGCSGKGFSLLWMDCSVVIWFEEVSLLFFYCFFYNVFLYNEMFVLLFVLLLFASVRGVGGWWLASAIAMLGA